MGRGTWTRKPLLQRQAPNLKTSMQKVAASRPRCRGWGLAAYSRLSASRAATHCFRAAFCRLLSRTRGRSAFISASASAAPLARPSAAQGGWHGNRGWAGAHRHVRDSTQARTRASRLTNQDGCQHGGAASVSVGAVHQHLAPRRPLRQRPADPLRMRRRACARVGGHGYGQGGRAYQAWHAAGSSTRAKQLADTCPLPSPPCPPSQREGVWRALTLASWQPARPTSLAWSICATVGACVSHTARLRYAGGVTCQGWWSGRGAAVRGLGIPVATPLAAAVAAPVPACGSPVCCPGCLGWASGPSHLQRQLARHVQHRRVHLQRARRRHDAWSRYAVAKPQQQRRQWQQLRHQGQQQEHPHQQRRRQASPWAPASARWARHR